MLQSTITHGEFVRWLAFFQLEPWPEARADWRAAMQAATVANSNRSERTRPYGLKDFLPDWDQAGGQDWRTMQARMRMAFGRKSSEET